MSLRLKDLMLSVIIVIILIDGLFISYLYYSEIWIIVCNRFN